MQGKLKPTVYLLNYADDRHSHKGGRFKENQEILNASARAQGIEHVISWSWEKLATTAFYKEHNEFLNKQRFENGNVWKPYIVLSLLETINTGDIVFYYDSGRYTIDVPIEPLVRLCVKNNGTLFHQWGETNAKWTKRDAFVYMGCDEKRYHNAPALQNTWFLIQKNTTNLAFVKEWLHFNLDERIASYIKPNTCGLSNSLDFVENRGDQSIFSTLAIKYRIKTFKGLLGVANRQINNFSLDPFGKGASPKPKNLRRSILHHTKSFWGCFLLLISRLRGGARLRVANTSFTLGLPDPVATMVYVERCQIPPEIDRFITLAQPNSCIFDVGAHTGVVSIPCAQKATKGQVWAFEPTPSTVNRLRQNAQLNAIENLHIVQNAVADTCGTATLMINEEQQNRHNTIGAPIYPGCRIIQHSTVPTVTLDQVAKDNHLSEIDMLNIDCEGAELSVLRGATTILSSVNAPLILYHLQHNHCTGFKYQPEEVNTLLRSNEYQLFWMQNGRLAPLETNPKHSGYIFAAKANHTAQITPHMADPQSP